MSMNQLREMYKTVFGPRGSSGYERVEDLRALFKELHQQGDCSKLFLGGRGGVS
ncbi:unnamed protein product, partial [Pylaiella littoralis]